MMENYYIGLMSGTSVDSLDAALVNLPSDGTCQLINTYSIPLPDNIRQCVKELIRPGNNEIEKLRWLDRQIADYSCRATHHICQTSNVPINAINAIGSHGQTVRHHPNSAETQGYSLQIGDPNIIAEATGITTVADFRRRDIAAGGQGAPLVPAFHRAAFHSHTEDRIILNLGGIANITHLLSTDGNHTLGYDTGPANTLLDNWCWKYRAEPFDHNSAWALSGTCDTTLLTRLLSDDYFSKAFPKSTGRELFNLEWITQALQTLDSEHRNTLSPEDIQATLLELSISSICNEIEKVDKQEQASVYACGGGANNTMFIQKLKDRMPSRKVSTTQALGIDPNWVEAIAFAWLAKQTIERKTANLPSATGASKEVILGGIYLGCS